MTLWSRRAAAILIAIVAMSAAALAHVGSPDVFENVQAGPYHLYVTVRPPLVVPGVADVEVLATDDDVQAVELAPMPLTGAAARFAPVADRAARGADDPHHFTGQLWMMSAGAWQVRVSIIGARGRGIVGIPVPTLPQSTRRMDRSLALLLGVFMLMLVSGAIAIVSAIAREATLPPGQPADRRRRRRGRLAGAITTAVILLIVVSGNWWWSAEASNYARYVYKPLVADTTIESGGRLSLSLRDPGWIELRRVDDLVEDHGHLMHLFLASPSLDRFWHLHPHAVSPSTFEIDLPPMPAGRLKYYADVVHATGIAETLTGTIDVPDMPGTPSSGDDSAWSGTAAASASASLLDDGGRMVWVRPPGALRQKSLTLFTFRVDDASGNPAGDLELYMGMPGHAIFMRKDGGVFAHVHPGGSAPMAAMALSEQSIEQGSGVAGEMPATMIGMTMPASLPSTVTFPYGFPTSGAYRIFVQVKRHGRIETAAFDADVQ